MLLQTICFFLVHMRYARPVVVPQDARTCDLIEFLQLRAADLAELTILHLDLGVVAKQRYHRVLHDPLLDLSFLSCLEWRSALASDR